MSRSYDINDQLRERERERRKLRDAYPPRDYGEAQTRMRIAGLSVPVCRCENPVIVRDELDGDDARCFWCSKTPRGVV